MSPEPKELLILRGLPASGKTSFSKNLQKQNPGKYKRINRDDLRHMLDDYEITKSNEAFVYSLRNLLIKEAFASGFSVICDDTNLKEKHLRGLKQVAKEAQQELQLEIQVNVHVMPTPLEECLKRDAQRIRPIGASRIRYLYQTSDLYEKQRNTALQYAEQNKDLPPCILCDLDGTLAKITKRNPYDTAKCLKDELNQPIFDLLELERKEGAKIILVTGRDERYKKQTIEWLEKNSIIYDHLYMRTTSDSRKDSLVKKEIYFQFIFEQYKVKYILDDRTQVVDMWRKELKLPCFQVNYGDF